MLGLATAAFTACDNGATTEPPKESAAVTIDVLAGDRQSALVGTQLPTALEVLVKDKKGKPLSNATIVWSVTGAQATPLAASTKTDADGLARNSVLFGTTAGTVMVHAHLDGTDSPVATFTLTALPGEPVGLVPATSFVGLPGDILAVGVKVQDEFGNGVPGLWVRWAGAGVAPDSSLSNADGIATTNIALPSTPSQVDLVAHMGEFSETFQVRAALVRMSALAGAHQRVEIGEAWPTELEVLVTDEALDDAPIPDLIVGWQVVSGKPELEALTSMTDEAGVARMRVTAGSTVGSERVRAVIGNVQVDFVGDVIGPNGEAAWYILSGNGQHGRVGTSLPEPFAVQVLDTRGVPVAGAGITWTKRPGSSGTIAQHTSSTNASGVAMMSGTFGLEAQDTLVVLVTSPVFPDTLTFHAIATNNGTAHFLVKDERTDGQQGEAYSILPSPIRVQVLDIDRHPVVGALVSWRLHDDSGAPCVDCGHFGQSGNVTAQSYTDDNGFAEMTWVLGPRMGGQFARAYVPGLGPEEAVRFTAYATSRNLASDIMVFDPHARFSGVRNTELLDPLRVVVVDSVRSPVAGVAVSWAVTTGNGMIRYATTTTDEFGVAENTFFIGTTTNNVVRATLNAIDKSVDFNIRGTYPAETIVVIDGNGQVLQADSTVIAQGVMFPKPLRIQVRDRDGVPVKNAAVVVAATQGGGGVSVDGHSFNGSIEVFTDYDGFVAVLRTAQEAGQARTSFAIKGTFKSVTFEGTINQR